jgi:hypothetical protein
MIPLPPRKKWQAITLATLVLAPAYVFLLIGVVAAASHKRSAPAPGPYVAAGLALIPFVFIVLAFVSQHPRAPGAVVRAMGLTLLVGLLTSAAVPDAVTGFVAGIGAGGVVGLRSELAHTWKSRAIAVLIAAVWVAITVRVFPGVALLLAPILPFTSIGVADHLQERKTEPTGSPV